MRESPSPADERLLACERIGRFALLGSLRFTAAMLWT
jgi:hypothetical protein